ncbi:hypothetical protein [Pseudomonas luteola]|uniref:hypothetical protein n=1 Tax=Pseudomonas luteola TaxID=47886 RepID=UPI001AD82E36|nr:hypothetical protein [Pseudomonas zeshuii]
MSTSSRVNGSTSVLGTFSDLMLILEEVCLLSLLGRPIKRCHTVLADKGYDSEALR